MPTTDILGDGRLAASQGVPALTTMCPPPDRALCHTLLKLLRPGICSILQHLDVCTSYATRRSTTSRRNLVYRRSCSEPRTSRAHECPFWHSEKHSAAGVAARSRGSTARRTKSGASRKENARLAHAAREKFGSSTFEKHARYFERTEGHHHFVEPRVSETEICVHTEHYEFCWHVCRRLQLIRLLLLENSPDSGRAPQRSSQTGDGAGSMPDGDSGSGVYGWSRKSGVVPNVGR